MSKSKLKPKLTAEQRKQVAKLTARQAAVAEMNKVVAMIRCPVTIYNTAERYRIPYTDFKLLYANKQFWVEDKPYSSAEAWVTSPDRREYRQLVYDPSETCPAEDFNMFPGWGVKKAVEGNITPWNKLLDVLYGAGTAERRYAEQWDGYPIKYPGTKLHTARLVWSQKHGVGKSTEAEILKGIYGAANVQDGVSDKDLDSQFNTWQENKQLIVVPECLVVGEDKRPLANKMKNNITNHEVTINDKYKSKYTTATCANYLFHSNHPDAMKLEDKDRRYHIAQVWSEPMPPSFWEEIYQWIRSKEGLPALRWHFENAVDYTGFNPHAPAPMTTAKEEMIEDTATPLQNWARALKESCDGRTLITFSELRKLANAQVIDAGQRWLDDTRLSNALKGAGLRKLHPLDKPKKGKDQVRMNGVRETFWALKDYEVLAKMDSEQLRERYTKEGNKPQKPTKV